MCSLSHLAICLAFASSLLIFFLLRCLQRTLLSLPVHRTLHCYAITFMFAHAIYFVTTTIDSCSCARTVCTTIGCMSRVCMLWKHFRLTFHHSYQFILVSSLASLSTVPQASPMGAIYIYICSCSARPNECWLSVLATTISDIAATKLVARTLLFMGRICSFGANDCMENSIRKIFTKPKSIYVDYDEFEQFLVIYWIKLLDGWWAY